MNLTKLFETQRELDAKILLSKGLVGHDLLDEKILALQVELGELANEWRGFKFWSEDQRPRGEDEYLEYRPVDQGGNRWVRKNPLLEEYVDCLHFILSIGNDFGFQIDKLNNFVIMGKTITQSFNKLFDYVSNIDRNFDEREYRIYLSTFIGLGEDLGFTDKQIEQAYMQKNEENHRRQANGY